MTQDGLDARPVAPECGEQVPAFGRRTPRSRLKRGSKGMTILEMVISLAIFMVLVAMTARAFVEPLQVVRAEESVMNLDANGDKALWQLARVLLSSVLPVRVDNEEKSELGTLYNDAHRGFGQYGMEWRSVLQQGSDCIPFSVPADYDGDGDTIDADGFPELGVMLSGVPVAAAEYRHVGVKRNNRLDGNIHPYMSSLNPADLGISTSEHTLDVAAPRFEQAFSFPDGADRAFGIVRFVPEREDDSPVIVDEAALNHDLNADGDNTDRFLLGRLEIVYPDVARTVDVAAGIDDWTGSGENIAFPLTGNVVLLQINKDEKSWEPIFKMIKHRLGATASNSASYDESSDSDGLYGIRVRLLLYDSRYTPTNRAVPVISRKYETLLKLRNIP
ncbi:MAG: prepilin-type N-terminal cleavage/methylation domain-containing protein [Planctomycetota bacterium]|jgi:hypothetical protein|nr:prepilin-type N-terminal cleavage/methylation domain-containing protein [Planctomycetota bacterium]